MTTKAWLSQRQISHVGAQIELLAEQNTSISLWTILVPAGTVLTPASTVVDQGGFKYEVVGQPVDRPDHRPIFRAAALRRISDMQN